MSKDHAEHNEKACTLLRADGQYFDWVVTTAFYSALHFVQNEIFPFTIGRRSYTCFDNYYNGYFGPGRKPSKHQTTIDLVASEIRPCTSAYRFLYDTSMTARYRKYKVLESIADKAIKELQIVKDNCSK